MNIAILIGLVVCIVFHLAVTVQLWDQETEAIRHREKLDRKIDSILYRLAVLRLLFPNKKPARRKERK